MFGQPSAVVVFGALALIPTGAVLYWLRPYRRLWNVVAVASLGAAATGAAAAIVYAVGRGAVPPSTLATWASLSVLRILLAPVLAAAFLVCALFTPYRPPRIALWAATAVELAVISYAALTWFLQAT